MEKSPGYTQEGLVAEIRRNSNYPAGEWRALVNTEPIDPGRVVAKLKAALDEADPFISRMPTDRLGLLFLEAGKVVQPDPDRLNSYRTHAEMTLGHWPSNPAIVADILDLYRKKPNGG